MIDFENLSEAERFRFNWTMGAIFVTFDNALYQHKLGVLGVGETSCVFRTTDTRHSDK
jgi:hypothetical protein